MNAASIIGETFEPACLNLVFNKLSPEVTLHVTDKLLQHLAVNGILVRDYETPSLTGEQVFAFQHSTTAFLLYHQMLPSRRQQAHVVIYDWFKGIYNNPAYRKTDANLPIMLSQLSLHGFQALMSDSSEAKQVDPTSMSLSPPFSRLFSSATDQGP